MVQGRSLDVRHGEELERAVLAGRVDGNGVRLVEPGEDLLLAQEAVAGLGQDAAVADDLDRHPAVQAFLEGFIDSAHAPMADLAQDVKLAQPLGDGRLRLGPRPLDVLPHLHQVMDAAGQVGVAAEVVLDRLTPALFQLGHELGQDFIVGVGL